MTKKHEVTVNRLVEVDVAPLTGANNDGEKGEVNESNPTASAEAPQLSPQLPPADPTVKPPDPFDPESLRLSQNFGEDLGVRTELLTIPVRRPSKEWWIRTHPSEAYRLPTAVIELKEDQEVFIVDQSLRQILSAETTFGPRLLVCAIARPNVFFIWPIRLPGSDGRIDQWSASALEAANLARHSWVRLQANRRLGAYEVCTTSATLPEPIWPDKSFGELLKIAFKDRFIDSFDHPVLKRLRGEA